MQAELNMSARQEDREGDLRARELFHYFQPDNPALMPSGQRDNRPCESPTAEKQSPNLVLTALAQLAALKLGVQRAVISLIDRETLYVIAEGSRSLNLANNDRYDEVGDGLWVGCSRGPVAGTLCEKTITLTPPQGKQHAFFVVEDLKEDPNFRHLSCVAEAPHFRYYAGTPLKTPNGTNIGSLYVIDPRPNHCLADLEKEMLGNIADAVMEYLETSRQSLEANRLTKLLAGLNAFVQGESTSDASRDSTHDLGRSDHLAASISRVQQSPDAKAEEHKVRAKSRSPPPLSSTPPSSDSFPDEMFAVTIPSPTRNRLQRSPRSKTETRQDQNENRTKRTFQYAANVMRESLDLGSNGGVVIASTGDDIEQDCSDLSDGEKEKKLAKIWAVSDTDHGPFETKEESGLYPASQMESRFLREHGGYPEVFATSTFSAPRVTPVASGEGPPVDEEVFPQRDEGYFLPLWDSLNSRWFGGAFCWSRAETRVFSAHVDLGGLFGFGSSLMVEHSRIQSQESAKQKGDFISTMSHELRSPLHGILASNELLIEHVNSEFAKRLLDTIRACGQTLLETFEQILDFTKINSFEREPTRSRSPHERPQRAQPQSFHIVKQVDVLTVIEEAVESVCSGQMLSSMMNGGGATVRRWQLDPNEDNNREWQNADGKKVDVFLEAAPQSWVYVLEPGALRRVVMNVFGNALKYTEAGSVSLHIEAQTSKNDNPALLLTVSDTGKGISHDYLRSNVFTPFSQENPMSPGAGLGLSLVRGILRSLGGTIAIKSQRGIGTVVKMTFPLTHSQHHKFSETQLSVSGALPSNVSPIDRVTAKLKGRRAFFYPVEDFQVSKPSSSSMIKQYLINWFGMASGDQAVPTAYDLVVVDERHLDQFPVAYHQSNLLVLSHRGPSLWSTATSSKRRLINATWLTLPCGPHQLARTLLESLQSLDSNKANTSNDLAGHEQSGERLQSNSNDLQIRKDLLLPPEVPVESTTSPPLVLSSVTDKSKTESTIAELDLPVHPMKETQETQPFPSTEVKNGPRILLVEDNAINLALLKKYISKIPTQVLDCAVNGLMAVELAQKMPQGYDYIFMDISMPVMDGFEATKAIRSIEAKRGTTSPAHIIALTGLGSDEHIRKAFAAGVNVFLRKPASLKDILAVLRK
ncbi:CheY-like superfamily [Penicillium longicatenatum]|uniref:CheY-like superfamily n=1 Tax=Penicillium longicatenatum TaxID=1561947 RepID=UPI002548E7CD|nr:CheY-like superfamily [Penicillium longicatenatum]KAJ5639483.1 CheY-like superfamily [Penicillium longicatenatum]